MAKNSFTVDGDNNDNSRFPLEEEKFENSKEDENKKYPSKEKKVKKIFLKHKRNTKKELHIGREIYTFWGHDTIEVSEKVLNHPDFENQRKYFLIKEV